MNNTVILVVGLVVVVLLLSKKPTPTAANGAPAGTGSSNNAPKDQTLTLIDDVAAAFAKAADAVKAGIQRN